MFESLPKTAAEVGDFQMYIDRTYSVTGVGAVASGTVNSGAVEAGDELLLGPMSDGEFREVEVRSIEMHYHRVDRANAGRIVGIALKGVRESEIERGMVLLPATPTRGGPRVRGRRDGSQPPDADSGGLRAGRPPRNNLRGGRLPPRRRTTPAGRHRHDSRGFKFRSYSRRGGPEFVFREGSSQRVGTVTDTDPAEYGDVTARMSFVRSACSSRHPFFERVRTLRPIRGRRATPARPIPSRCSVRVPSRESLPGSSNAVSPSTDSESRAARSTSTPKTDSSKAVARSARSRSVLVR